MPSHNEGQGEVTLARTLGLFDATMIGVGAMIGAGVFVLTGIALGEGGPAAIIAFALNGIVTMFTAFSYAELASAIPEAGGGYSFVNPLRLLVTVNEPSRSAATLIQPPPSLRATLGHTMNCSGALLSGPPWA